jgi:hypothetical protein
MRSSPSSMLTSKPYAERQTSLPRRPMLAKCPTDPASGGDTPRWASPWRRWAAPRSGVMVYLSKSGGSYHDAIIDEHCQSVVSMVEGV